MNLTQVLILLLQLINISKVSELSGETLLSQNVQLEVYSVNLTQLEENL